MRKGYALYRPRGSAPSPATFILLHIVLALASSSARLIAGPLPTSGALAIVAASACAFACLSEVYVAFAVRLPVVGVLVLVVPRRDASANEARRVDAQDPSADGATAQGGRGSRVPGAGTKPCERECTCACASAEGARAVRPRTSLAFATPRSDLAIRIGVGGGKHE